MKSPASMKEYVRSQKPEVFEGWDGFMIIFTAAECRNPEHECMVLTLINESKEIANFPENNPHAVLQIDHQKETGKDVRVVSWNGQTQATD